MKTHTLRPLRLLVALISLIGITASAQIITTFETISSYSGSDISFLSGKALTQTFTNVKYIQSMTYRFVRTSGASSTTLQYYFVEWDTINNKAGTGIQGGTISVPPLSSFTTYTYGIDLNEYSGYDFTFNLNYTANATKTYAMILWSPTNASAVKLQQIDGADAFPYGTSYFATGISGTSGGSGLTQLQTNTSTPYVPAGTDWGFSQIAVELGPVPEPATAAAGLGALLVAGLVALRMMQRRRAAALTPIPVTTA